MLFLVDARQQEAGIRRGRHIPGEVAIHFGNQEVMANDITMGGNLENGKCNRCEAKWAPAPAPAQ